MAAKFQPLAGESVAVRVAAVLVRTAKGDEWLRCGRWELVLAEVECEAPAVLPSGVCLGMMATFSIC